MITEVSVIDRVEVLMELGHVGVRRADRVLKNGVMIAETFHRHVLTPGADLSQEHPRVAAIVRAVWGPE